MIIVIKIFTLNFLQLSIKKNIIATLRIVSIENSELTLLLILYFYHGKLHFCAVSVK